MEPTQRTPSGWSCPCMVTRPGSVWLSRVGLGLSDAGCGRCRQEAMLRLWRELGSGTELRVLDAWAFRTTYRWSWIITGIRNRLAGCWVGSQSVARQIRLGPSRLIGERSASGMRSTCLPVRQARSPLSPLPCRPAIRSKSAPFWAYSNLSQPAATAQSRLSTLRRRLGQEES